METRNKRILRGIDITRGVGLEIGPLTTPVISKGQGEIYYLDHLSLEELKRKYKDELPNLGRILPVDYVLKDNNLKKSVKGKKFDYVVASHVIEHVPDVITWLEDIASVLKPGGVVALAIPDKRFTFDLERKVTDTSEIVGAYVDKIQRTTSAAMYDYASSYIEDVDSTTAWNDEQYYQNGKQKYRWTHKEALRMSLDNRVGDDYIDSHCYAFTPGSFLDNLKELTELGLVNFDIYNFLETQPGELEFYISLKKRSSNRGSRKSPSAKVPSVHDRNQKEEKLIAQIQLLQQQIDSMTVSSSWRLTKPLRSLNKLVRRKES